MKVIGMQVRDRTSKKTNRDYKEAILYCTYTSSRVTGTAVERVSCLAETVPDGLQLGDEINVFYNRFGSVEAVERI